MVELALAILGGAFLVWLGWFAMRAVRSERRADQGRWRGKREGRDGKTADGRGQAASAGEEYERGGSVYSIGFWSW